MVNIEKDFDSVNHLFLVSALEKYGFKNNFIRWIKLLLKKSGVVHNKRGTNNKLFQIKKRYKTRRPFISISFHSRLRNSIH